MKNSSLLMVLTPIVSFFTGCASPNQYGHVTKVATTNIVGTAISQREGGEEVIVYRQQNYTISHTSKPVVPPMPSSGIYGATPMQIPVSPSPAAEEPQVRSRQSVQPSRPVYRDTVYGTHRLASSRSAHHVTTHNPSLGTFFSEFLGVFIPGEGAEVRSASFRTRHGSGAAITASARAHGRVGFSKPSFLHKAREHRRQIGTEGPWIGASKDTVYSAGAAVGGAGIYRSGLDISRGQR